MDITFFGILLVASVLLIIASGLLRDDSLLVIPAVMFWLIGLNLVVGNVTTTAVLSVNSTVTAQTVPVDVPYKTLTGLLFIVFGVMLFFAAYSGSRRGEW